MLTKRELQLQSSKIGSLLVLDLSLIQNTLITQLNYFLRRPSSSPKSSYSSNNLIQVYWTKDKIESCWIHVFNWNYPPMLNMFLCCIV